MGAGQDIVPSLSPPSTETSGLLHVPLPRQLKSLCTWSCAFQRQLSPVTYLCAAARAAELKSLSGRLWESLGALKGVQYEVPLRVSGMGTCSLCKLLGQFTEPQPPPCDPFWKRELSYVGAPAPAGGPGDVMKP